MISILNENDIMELINSDPEKNSELKKALVLVKNNDKVQVRKKTTAKGTFVRVYTYDRYLYRYICSLTIQIE